MACCDVTILNRVSPKYAFLNWKTNTFVRVYYRYFVYYAFWCECCRLDLGRCKHKCSQSGTEILNWFSKRREKEGGMKNELCCAGSCFFWSSLWHPPTQNTKQPQCIVSWNLSLINKRKPAIYPKPQIKHGEITESSTFTNICLVAYGM